MSRAGVHLPYIVESMGIRHKTEENGNVVVKTMVGDFGFDKVVGTDPLGCLKTSKARFIAGLSQNVNRAVASVSYSRLEKAFVAFPWPVWKQTPMVAFKSRKASPIIEYHS